MGSGMNDGPHHTWHPPPSHYPSFSLFHLSLFPHLFTSFHLLFLGIVGYRTEIEGVTETETGRTGKEKEKGTEAVAAVLYPGLV